MNEDYLWSGRGDPDPEVARLEALLGSLRYRVTDVPEPIATPAQSKRPRRWVAMAATSLAIAAVALLAFWPTDAGPPQVMVQAVSGEVRLANRRLEAPASLSSREWLDTGDTGSAVVEVPEFGLVEVLGGSRFRQLEAEDGQRRFELAWGRVRVDGTAPPRLLMIETPSAVAVDLGCAYELFVGEDGLGYLEVHEGRVSLEDEHRTSVTVAGMRCATYPGFGPGTPYFESADPALRSALAEFDQGHEEMLDVVLARSSRADAVTLWNLLERVPESRRTVVFERLASLVAPPVSESRELARIDESAMGAWLDSCVGESQRDKR